MTEHTSPSVHGMGAFEGLQSGILLQQRAVTLATLALAGLDDTAFAVVIGAALRDRHPNAVEAALEGLRK